MTLHPTTRRSGVTLTEVLMAVMLMGIGVVTLASLFPISVLNSIKATQLTNATALRYNAEAMIENLGPQPAFRASFPVPANVSDPPVISIIDPLGFIEVSNSDPGMEISFGHLSDGTTTGPIQRVNLLNGHTVLPDSWITIVEGVPDLASLTSTEYTFADAEINLNDVSITSTAPSRILMFGEDGRSSISRTLTGVNNQTCTWTEPLPNGFVPERAKILTQEERYSYIITARTRRINATAASSEMTVVVFFRRGYDFNDERIWEGPSGKPAFKAHSNQVQITFDPTTEEPFLKKGGFILDAVNGHWYRIKDYATWNGLATITIDRNALQDSNGGILMPGIVEVYPIGIKSL